VNGKSHCIPDVAAQQNGP